MSDLFTSLDLLGQTLPNRIFLSAMTRTRASDDGVPTDLMRDYYVQRASAGLIVTECTQVSDQGHGVIRCPGIHREDQIAGWRKVTDAVHAAGGRIVCQIWHCGRVSHPDMRGGERAVAPSPIAAEGKIFTPEGYVEIPEPRQLAINEIAPIVEDFAAATRNARVAGFDGVELHGANGYLQDQFLQDNSNRRTDAYGGAVANRARLMIETVEAMIAAWDGDHVGIRLSPAITLYGMHDSNKRATFSHVIGALDTLKPAYLCLLDPNEKDAKSEQIKDVLETFRSQVSVPVIGNTGFDKIKGNAAIGGGKADAIAFGVPFLANPDLPERFRRDAPLNKPDPETFYGEASNGYTDYPALETGSA
jgi:N-ethylmaleimide reductase